MSLKGAVVCVAHHWITCPSMVNFAYIFILLTSEAPPLERNFSSTDPPRSWVPDTAIELTHTELDVSVPVESGGEVYPIRSPLLLREV